MNKEALPRYAYSVEEAARQIGIGRSKMFELIKYGKIKAIKCGARTLVPDSSLMSFLATSEPAAVGAVQ